MTTESKPKRISQISEQTDYIEKSLEELLVNVGSLEDRLKRVLTEQPPQEKSDPEKEMAVVPLASILREFAAKITHISNRVGSISGRVEL